MMDLQGRNEIERIRTVAEELRSAIMKHEGVVGIVFTGGLVRGFADRYSDIDMMAFLDRKDENVRRKLKRLAADEHKRSGVDVDLEVHILSDFAERRWNEINRWDFSHAEIVFDPKRKIKRMFDEKLRVPKSFWLKRIAVCAEHLRWYCCPLIGEEGSMAEAWVARGSLASAHYCVSYGLDMIFAVLFALNKEFLPPQKWRISYSYGLKWQPDEYRKSVEEIIAIRSLSADDVGRRLDALRTMWQRMLPKIKRETGLDAESMSKLYVEKVLHQT